MYEVLEYFYCLIYVSSLTFCVYKYLDRKPKLKELIVFLLMYGFVNYIITGKIIIDIKYRIVIDFLSILNDFIFICLLNKKIELYLFVYVTLFSTIYLQSVVLILDLINQIDKYYVFISLEPSFLRFMLVILFNIITVVIYKILEKKTLL